MGEVWIISPIFSIEHLLLNFGGVKTNYFCVQANTGEVAMSTRDWLELVAKRLVVEFTQIICQIPPANLAHGKSQLQADAGASRLRDLCVFCG